MSDTELTLRRSAYVTNGYQAPNRCETCDVALPDEASRKKHMQETKHRSCPLCDKYVPVGGYYNHAFDKHPDERWNEHQVAWTDMKDRGSAQSWAVKEGKN
ncbi:unnamed protein product [Clonostachys rosea]|uniref:C2H2-type domain-containing protein n=1 Tax=Bionectria ochroleuca TaxID=29856 RepID=A0ABY6UW29_BIOOC|nr:unnamed protein product [Clonostachys rosea]